MNEGPRRAEHEQNATLRTQPADGAVVGLVTQGVGAGVAETQMSAGQDERISQVRQTDDALVAVVTVFIIGGLKKENKMKSKVICKKTFNNVLQHCG